MFATQVEFNYKRDKLLQLVQDVADKNQLFEKPVPISAFDKAACNEILQTLQIQYGQQLFNFKVSTVTVACLKPFERSAIHKDSDELGRPTKSALNLPLSSCEGVKMNWYSLKPNGTIKQIRSARGWPIEGLSMHNAVKLFTFPCDKPFVVDPTQFHDIENTTDKYHLIMSVR